MFSVNGHLASTPETYGETESIVVERRFSPCCDFEEEGERRTETGGGEELLVPTY